MIYLRDLKFQVSFLILIIKGIKRVAGPKTYLDMCLVNPLCARGDTMDVTACKIFATDVDL